MVRPCGDLAHTSYGVFIPNPLGKTAAKKYWPFHESAARAQHKWGSDDSFCRSPIPFARPLELRSAGIVCHHVNCVSLKVQGPWTKLTF